MTGDPRTHRWSDSLVASSSIQMMGLAGALITVTLPLTVGAVADWYKLAVADAGRVATLEMGGCAVGAFVAAWLVARHDRRKLGGLAYALLLVPNICALLNPAFGTLLILRGISGIGEGALLGIMSAAIAQTRSPDRQFAVFVIISFLMAALMFRAVPAFAAIYGPRIIVVILMAVAALALALLRAFPRGTQSISVENPRSQSPESIPSIGREQLLRTALALLAVLFFYVGLGIVWPLMQRIGLSVGVSASEVARVLSFTSLAGLVGAITALLLGVRLGREGPLFFGLSGVAASLAALAAWPGANSFALAPLAFLFMWNFTFPYLMGTLAVLDPSGRTLALNLSVQFIGFSVGPVLGTTLAARSTYSALAAAGSTSVIGCLLVLVIGTIFRKRLQISVSATAG